MERFERRELKYYVPFEQYEVLFERVLCHMKYDSFCEAREDHMYHVRSIYLDTQHYLFFYEKIDGNKIRKKLRIRTYNNSDPESRAFLEIKRKIDNTVFKERVRIKLIDSPKLLNGAELVPDDDNSHLSRTALNRFVYLTKALNLHPKVLITYERVAFIGVEDPNVRITFDLNTRSYPNPDIEDIFREADLKSFSDPYFILEIKFYGTMPLWTRQIVRDFHLRVQSISKYCNGLEVWVPTLSAKALHS